MSILLENEDYAKRIVARHFSNSSILVSRVTEGGSTVVFRVVVAGTTFYLRVLPEVGASFAPEAEVHRRLRALGVRVPEVVYFEACNELFERSIMLTTEIAGKPVSESAELSREELEQIVVAAGRDLALVNSVGVEGFGWLDRSGVEGDGLRGEKTTFREFALESWVDDLGVLAAHGLDVGEVRGLDGIVARYEDWLGAGKGLLAHGDFDVTHIYQLGGEYSGIIDFGEIRGADRWYDLGHFHVRDGERLGLKMGSALVQGYGEVVALPGDYEERIRFASVLINVRALARALRRGRRDGYVRHQFEVLREDIRELMQV